MHRGKKKNTFEKCKMVKQPTVLFLDNLTWTEPFHILFE